MEATKQPAIVEPIDDELPTLALSAEAGPTACPATCQQQLLMSMNHCSSSNDLSSAVDTVYQSMDQSRYLASCVISAEAARVNKRLIDHRQQQLQRSSNKRRKLVLQRKKDKKTPEDEEEPEAPPEATVDTKEPQQAEEDSSQAEEETKERQQAQQVRQQRRHPDEILLYQQACRSHRMIQLFQQLEHIQGSLMDEMMACADDAELRQQQPQQHS